MASSKFEVWACATKHIDLSCPGVVIDDVEMEPQKVFLAHSQIKASDNGLYVWNGADVPATRVQNPPDEFEIRGGTINADKKFRVSHLYREQ